ncbi:MAG: lanthionine synthetase LanC family protein [Acidimicrobiales bacterium]
MSAATYAEQLEDAVGALRILPRSRFSWRGTPMSRSVATRVDAAGDGLRERLTSVLYDEFYRRRGVAGAAPGGVGWANGDPAFVAELSRSNRGGGGWETGWVVRDTTPDHLTIAKDGLTVRAPRTECRNPTPATTPAPGSVVELRYPNERRNALPGFYVAFGDEPLPAGEPLVRVYWNVTSAGAPLLIDELTGRLNGAGVPFQLKLVDHPSGFDRCDTAVLYFPAASAGSAIPIVADTYRQVAPEMGSRVPAFTRRLADGLAMAEDPGGGDSFGTHRCGLVADGVLRAHDDGAENLSDRVQIVRERFTEAGIDPTRPYQRSLDLDRMVDGHLDDDHRRARPSTDPGGDVSFLAAAAGIGRRLCDEAIWDGDACNWVGRWDDQPTGGREHRSLGHDLYAGTSGVGWFLAHLAMANGDARTTATAIGALRHALTSATRSDARLDVGLFTGIVGVAVAAAHVASVLDDDDLRAAANRLIEKWLGAIAVWDDADANVDFISGRAGVVVGVLTLHRGSRDDRLLTLAAEIGADLMGRAHRTGRGDSWPAPRIKATHDLTGLSHGAAGPALALAELSVATGSREFRRGAERAVAYERSWYDPSSGNWPDFRADRPEGAEPASCATLWCHGATGIGLTRLRLAAVFDDASMAAEARQAMTTVRSAVERSLRASGPSWCLCHGLAGNADALLHAGSVSNDPVAAACLETANAVGRAGTKRIRSWTTPGADGLPFGLMTGLAGIGLFLLRLCDPTIPSPLLLQPDKLVDVGVSHPPMAGTTPLDGRPAA